MVFQLNDFTDSEDEPTTAPPSPVASTSTPRRRATNRRVTPSSPAGTASARVSASPRGSASARDHARGPSASSTSGHPLRITLRTATQQPTDSPDPSSTSLPTRSAPDGASQRSSLSPPPPITLKLSKPPRQSLAEKATYSSSEDEHDAIPEPIYYQEDDLEADKSYRAGGTKAKKPASKKAKTAAAARKASSSTSASIGASVFGGPGTAGSTTVPPPSAAAGGKKKTYDWLAPSSVSASHSGPQQREAGSASGSGSGSGGKGGGGKKDEGSIGGRDDSEMEIDSVVAEDVPVVPARPVGPPAKKRQKKAAGEGGPAKAPRKSGGQKKIKALLAESYLETPSHEGSSPNLGGMMSVDGTPEPLDVAQYPPGTRGNTPPFERADPVKLGFPVFSRPIVVPEFSLGAFPRVTQFFAPINGGDASGFPRKEKVRNWKHHTSTLKGIGGGTLMYKAWAGGPPSELGRLVQADRDVKEIQRAAKKANAASASASAPLTSAPLFTDSALPLPDSRPGLTAATSTDSVFQVQAEDGDVGSEVGDGHGGQAGEEGSVKAETTAAPVKPKAKGAAAKVKVSPATKKKAAGAGGAGASKPKAKPKKSKLAQEIVPLEPEPEPEAEAEVGVGAEAPVVVEAEPEVVE